MKLFCIWNIITGLYRVAHQSGHFQAPVPKIKRDKSELNQQPLQSAPLIDKYIAGIQTRQTPEMDDNSPPLTPLTIGKPTLKAVFQTTKQPKSAEDRILEGEPPVSQPSNTTTGHYTQQKQQNPTLEHSR